ncbi:restriction endonuclease subunit S [Flavobacterium coralii]|uniref:restriction endonuclease subunit S n=1 Tax=Flavobacterium coralii TaxID=2838017 RepID=UPI000C3C95B4|nr:hypothetical protein [Flavobacterium sp.]|tara:strand:- start:3033 stop:4286 length:1254 start_codon:yes stop_codon:yes gene_type:complete
MNNEDNLIPQYRFPEFKNDGSWELHPIADKIDYERPDKYIVKNTNYVGDGTPVLTANKSFILGYTNENEGIYKNNLPVIIFDDFTVDNKFVDFPFKVKSSAIKILKNKDYKDSLEFFYGLMSQIKFEAKEHKRYYISSYQNIEIPFPINPAEQRKIAACLSSLDDVITGHQEKLQVLEDHKNGLMQNLFPQEGETTPRFRFPEFQDDGEWMEKTIIDTADKNIKWSFTGGPFGSNLKSSDYTSNGIRIIQLQNIGDGIFKNDYKIYTSIEKADELLSCNIYSGDIILSKMGDPVGRACIMPGVNERYLMASDGIRLAVDEKEFSKYFIFSSINSDNIRKKIEAKSTGSTRKRIGLDILKQILLLVPSNIKEQQKIADVLSSVDELIAGHREKIDALKEHKRGLMQGLFPKIESKVWL